MVSTVLERHYIDEVLIRFLRRLNRDPLLPGTE